MSGRARFFRDWGIAALLVCLLLPWRGSDDSPAASTYRLMGESLVLDGDLRFDSRDRGRVFTLAAGSRDERFLLHGVEGLGTARYPGSPLWGALSVAAMAGFGERGAIGLQVLFLALAVALARVHLRRFNPVLASWLLAAAVLLLGSAPWLAIGSGPLALQLLALTLALCLGYTATAGTAGGAAALSGAALAVAAFDCPPLLCLAPGLFVTWWLGCRRRLPAFVLAALGSLALLAETSRCLGGSRWPAPIETARLARAATEPSPPALALDPGMELSPVHPVAARFPRSPGSALDRLRLGLYERHGGFLLYAPAVPLCLLLFLLHHRRCRQRLVLLAGAAAALLLLVLPAVPGVAPPVPGQGALLLPLVPVSLFLVTRLAPWPAAAAGLVWAASLGLTFGVAAALEPAAEMPHAGRLPFRLFPADLRWIEASTAYACHGELCARVEQLVPRHAVIELKAGERAEAWLRSRHPLGAAMLVGRDLAPGESIRLRLEGGKAEARVSGDVLALRPKRDPQVHGEDPARYVYRLTARTRKAAKLVYLGDQERVERDIYRVTWLPTEPPPAVQTGQLLHVHARLGNASQGAWPAMGEAAVALSYHWLDREGKTVVWEGLRSALGFELEPGGFFTWPVAVRAPDRAGEYTLMLDLVYENVAWFSERDARSALRLPVTVVAAKEVTP